MDSDIIDIAEEYNHIRSKTDSSDGVVLELLALIYGTRQVIITAIERSPQKLADWPSRN